MKGYIHIYTGNGKGKTTAALGLALRAAGAGMNVFIIQFMKGTYHSELNSLARLNDLITVKQFGRDRLIRKAPEPEDIRYAEEGLEEARRVIATGTYQVVILDEANTAVHFRLISADDLLELMASKPEHVELVLTGRYADPRVIEKADLVTEMREIKNYYEKGVQARIGIEK